MADYTLEMRLVISDFDCLPEDITEMLELTPDHVSKKGEIKRKGAIIKRNTWRLASQAKSEGSTVQQQWAALSKVLKPSKANFKRLPKNANKKAAVIVYAYNYMPNIIIPVQVMRELAGLHLEIQVSIYDLVENG